MASRLHDTHWKLFELLTLVRSPLPTSTIHRRICPRDTSGRSCWRFLRKAAEDGLIEQLTIPLVTGSSPRGRPPTAYRLTRQGAAIYAEYTGQDVPLPSETNRSPLMLRHQIGLAHTVLAWNDACELAAIPKPAWLHEFDTYPQAKGQGFSDRFLLRECFALDGKTVVCWPDLSFYLRVPHTSEAGTRWAEVIGAVEYDRSTESISQCTAKLTAYQHYLTQAIWRQHWPQAGPQSTVRIFFIVQSTKRLENLAQAMRDRSAAHAVRLTTVAAMTPQRLLTEPIWETVQRKRLAILGASALQQPPAVPPQATLATA